MPRGQKSKLRAQQRRSQARKQARALQDAQATAAQEADSPSCSSPVAGDAAGLPQKSLGAPPTSTAAAPAVSHKRSGKGLKRRDQEKERATSSKAPPSTESSNKVLLERKAEMVLQYMMYKYKMKEPIVKGEMLKIVPKRFRKQFPEILKIASEHMELVFGLELKEVKPGSNSYTLTTILDLPSDNSDSDFPKTGLLLPLLSNIFLHGCSATEKDVWEFLTTLGVTEGSRHFIFGDVRKLITVDLVEEEYLEYCEVPGSDPPCYQFLWGRRAHAETSKIKVMEFLAKVTFSEAIDFPSYYEEVLKDQKERAQGKVAAKSGATAQASLSPKASSSLSTP